MDVTFQVMDVTVCEKHNEISDIKNINSLFIHFFLTNVRKLAISFKISFIFLLFHLQRMETCFWSAVITLKHALCGESV